MVNDFQNYEVLFLGKGCYIEGYGGVLFVNGRVNIDGELVELIYKSEASYPNNLGALNFDPFYTFLYLSIPGHRIQNILEQRGRPSRIRGQVYRNNEGRCHSQNPHYKKRKFIWCFLTNDWGLSWISQSNS